jgi:3-oxoacyl-[acyl-carrier protein] reductase
MLARLGAAVAVNHLADDPRGLQAMDRLIGKRGKGISAPASVGESGTAERMAMKADSDLGRLDLLVNNAGMPGTHVADATTPLPQAGEV